jgi:hypothetical protein
MRRVATSLVVLACLAAACGGGAPTPAATNSGATPTSSAVGGATPGATATSGATNTPAATTGAPSPVSSVAAGGDIVHVVLTGGPAAGTYSSAVDDPHCTLGLIGPGAWGVQWSIADAAAGQISSVQLVLAAKGHEDDENAMFKGTALLLSVTVGSLMDGTTFDVDDKTDDSQDKGSGSAQVQDSGSAAVIHAIGTTKDGVKIDATVNCPTVSRS